MELIIELPIRIKKNKYKNNQYYYLNMNQYVKWNHNQRNNIIKNFKEEIIKDKFPENFKFNKPIEIEAQLYLKLRNKDGEKSKTRKDKSNVYAVVFKVFYDALTENGIITDDNDNFIKKETILETIEITKQEEQKIVIKMREISE